jgi:hypothetical protein
MPTQLHDSTLLIALTSTNTFLLLLTQTRSSYRYVINPSGGLISKGHPLGATGLAQCAELCWQLRGEADKRQVKNAKVGLQHNLGLGGACVVTMYKRPTDAWAQGVAPVRTKSGAMGFTDGASTARL